MAVAAFVALVHDIVIATGVYALAGFQVSPATVIGLLTILGYSLYDTVVVFDKVRENTAGLLGGARSDLQPGGEPGPEPDPGQIDQHLADRAAAGRRDPGRRDRAARRQQRAQGTRAGAVRRHAVRHLLLDLHRHPGAGDLKEREPQYKALAKRVACAPPAAARPSGPWPRRSPGRAPGPAPAAAELSPAQLADGDDGRTTRRRSPTTAEPARRRADRGRADRPPRRGRPARAGAAAAAAPPVRVRGSSRAGAAAARRGTGPRPARRSGASR